MRNLMEIRRKLVSGVVLMAGTLGLSMQAQAWYVDLNPATYHEYFIHLGEELWPGGPNAGDVGFESVSDILTPPDEACGLRFEDVEGANWQPGNSVAHGSASQATVYLPRPGCGNASVSIEFDGAPLAFGGGSVVALQSWIAYWIDEDGEKIYYYCNNCVGPTDLFIGYPDYEHGSLQLDLSLLCNVSESDSRSAVLRTLYRAQDTVAEYQTKMSKAILKRQRGHGLDRMEPSMQALETQIKRNLVMLDAQLLEFEAQFGQQKFDMAELACARADKALDTSAIMIQGTKQLMRDSRRSSGR